MKKMTQKHQLMAYVLNKEFGYIQKDIANLMRVSQSTISSAIKEIEYQKIIRNLETELIQVREETRDILIKNGYKQQAILFFDEE